MNYPGKDKSFGNYSIALFAFRMSVRVVARIRPLLKTERETDIIVRSGTSSTSKISVFSDANTPKPKRKKNENVLKDRDNVVRIPNPKNEAEEYSFQFNGVYGSDANQQEVFDAEGGLYAVIPFYGFHRISHVFNQLTYIQLPRQ